MNFNEALKKLNIEDYGQRIFSSNSHGELFHLQQYVSIAELLDKIFKNTDWFREWFEDTVQWSNENWKRPNSVYQHIQKLLNEFLLEQIKMTP